MKKWLYNNSLSAVFLLLFLLGLGGQIYFGLLEYNKDLQEWGGETVNFYQYLHSGHFIEATFENWESEFTDGFIGVVYDFLCGRKVLPI